MILLYYEDLISSLYQRANPAKPRQLPPKFLENLETVIFKKWKGFCSEDKHGKKQSLGEGTDDMLLSQITVAGPGTMSKSKHPSPMPEWHGKSAAKAWHNGSQVTMKYCGPDAQQVSPSSPVHHAPHVHGNQTSNAWESKWVLMQKLRTGVLGRGIDQP